MILTQVIYIGNILRNTAFFLNFVPSEETESFVVADDLLQELPWLEEVLRSKVKVDRGQGGGQRAGRDRGLPMM